MKARSVASMGALHPILFFAVMYIVVLFFSIFICSSLFYSCQSSSAKLAKTKKTAPVKQQNTPGQVSTAVVLR